MERPNEYTLAGGAMLLSGLTNIALGVVLFVSTIMICIGCFWVFPIMFGFVELLVGVAILNGKRVYGAVLIAGVGAVAGCVNFNMIGVTADIVAITLLLQPKVVAWLQAEEESGPAEW